MDLEDEKEKSVCQAIPAHPHPSYFPAESENQPVKKKKDVPGFLGSHRQ